MMIIEGVFDTGITQIDSYVFEVKGANSLHFTLLDGAFEHFFVLVKDPLGTLRALLSYKTRVKTYCLSTSYLHSDNYTLAGELYDGTWSIEIVRTYPVQGGYKLQIESDLGTAEKKGKNPLLCPQSLITDKRTGWYRGDFHMHSAYTDGRVSLEEIELAAKAKQLDFISMTDHSTVTTKFPETEFPVIPALEITWDDEGHYNAHGLKDFPDYAYFVRSTSNKDEALDLLFRHLRAEGCLLTINHPFPYGWELKHNYDIRSFDTLEVINAPHLLAKEVNNERAVRFFDFLWRNGHYLKAIGGSDAHKKNYFEQYPVGIPITKVYCKGLSVQNILEAARRGNSFLQTEEDFEVLYHRPESTKKLILPGEQVEGQVALKGRCHVRVRWQLVKNGIIVQETEGRRFQSEIDIKENEYYRLQARSFEDELLLFVNPIHNMTKKAEICFFQDILKGFYRTEKMEG